MANDKTIPVEEVFNKLKFDHEYDACYFLANEREQSSKYEITILKEKIFSKLLGNAVKILRVSRLTVIGNQ